MGCEASSMDAQSPQKQTTMQAPVSEARQQTQQPHAAESSKKTTANTEERKPEPPKGQQKQTTKEPTKEPIKEQPKEQPKEEPKELPKNPVANKQMLGNTKDLPPSSKLEFKKTEEQVLSGKFSTEKTGKEDKLNIKPEDCFDTFGVVSLYYQNACYTDGNYNNNDWKIEKGDVAGIKAYRIHPPTGKFKNFLASKHCISFNLPDKASYKLYKFQGGAFTQVAQAVQKDVKPGTWNLFNNITISELGGPVTYLVERSSKKLTVHTPLKGEVEGSTVFQDKNIKIEQIKIPLPEEAPIPQAFDHGPGSHYNCYSPNRVFWRIGFGIKQVIVWPTENKESAYLTHFDRSNFEHKSIKLQIKKGFMLASATGDSQFLYYTVVEPGPAVGKKDTRVMMIIKADITSGKVIKQEKLPTDKQNLNIYDFDSCTLALNGKTIALVVSRKMTQSDDGLNHQGCFLITVNTDTLTMSKKHGQTSSHSFANSVVARSDGKFSGMDLADNYPRGVHCWNFDDKECKKKLVYCFKTLHGDQPKNMAGKPFPQYNEISTNNKKFYKWSNDNKTYTELAAPGLVEVNNGVFVVFAGENMPSPMDSSKTGDYVNCSRNVGFVKVAKELDDTLNCILSDGPVLEGGFFSFGGTWEKQTMKGIRWITKLQGEESASRVKTALVGDRVLILFEVWNKTSYLHTQYVLVKADGTSSDPVKLPTNFRLHKADDMFTNQETVSALFFVGEKGKVMSRYQIKLA